MASAKLDDKIIQHQKVDNIVAVFRNRFLPLDTLMTSVPFGVVTQFKINKAVYFDQNASDFDENSWKTFDSGVPKQGA